MQYGYDFVWFLSYGFWVAFGAAILSFVGAVAPSLVSKKPVQNAKPKAM